MGRVTGEEQYRYCGYETEIVSDELYAKKKKNEIDRGYASLDFVNAANEASKNKQKKRSARQIAEESLREEVLLQSIFEKEVAENLSAFFRNGPDGKQCLNKACILVLESGRGLSPRLQMLMNIASRML